MSEEIQSPNPESTPMQSDAAPPVPPKISFADLGLRAEVLQAVSDMGFQHPMEVQSVTIPRARTGRDLMIQSRTGSGKTAAFGIPLVDGIVDAKEKFVQAIVLLPTRELALQVAAELARISAHSGVQVVPVYGGAPMGRQIEQLRDGGQIVCGTPGRILDHLRRGTLKLDRVRCAVLDECDEMLSMGFQEDIEHILERTPAERQTLLFSATVPEGIQRISRRFMRSPEFLKLSADFIGVHEIRHVYYSIPGGQREAELLRVLAFENPERAIIFCNTRDETGRVAEFLRRQGLDAEAISSDLSQADREKVMTRMRAGGIRFLVATDVAARGIDLENLPAVINYTIPESAEIYIHRTGRTGRAGRHGTAISLIGPAEVGSFYYIKLLYKIRPEERSLPSEGEIRSKREGEKLLQLRAVLPPEPGAEWRSLARRLLVSLDGEAIVAGLLARTLAGDEGARVAAEAAARPPSAPSVPSPPARPREDRDLRARDERDRPPRRDLGAPRDARRDRERRPAGDDRMRRDRERDRRPPRDRDAPLTTDAGAPPARPASAQSAPPTARSGPALPRSGSDQKGEGREFWEVWSEESGRATTRTAQEEAGAPTVDAGDMWTEGAPAAAPPTTQPGGSPDPGIDPGAGKARLYLNLGRKDGASAEEIAALLTGEGVGTSPAEIELMNTHSYVNVPAADAERLCRALADREHNGRRLVCESARPPKRR